MATDPPVSGSSESSESSESSDRSDADDVRDLPDDPDLDQLRRQARELQRAHPGSRLHEAQLRIARRYGFGGWPALKRYVERVRSYRRTPDELGPQDDPHDEFLRLACLTYGTDDPERVARAAGLLAARPDLVEDNVWVAAACADAAEVGRLLARDPRLAGREGGPHRWAPLAYVAYARHDPDVTEAAATTTVRLLLEAGADPDTGYLWHGLPSPFTALTGMFGEGEGGAGLQPAHPHAFALARQLLEAGADPNDSQTLYNRMFRPDDRHLELLFEFGLGTGDGGPWKRRLGRAAMGPAEMLVDQLGWAVVHGMTDRVRLLVEHGVDVDAPIDGQGLFGEPVRPVEAALRSGQLAVADLLSELGAPTPAVDPEVEVVSHVLAADRARVEALARDDADVVRRARQRRPGLVVWAAALHRPDAVRLAVELGWDVSALARSDVPSDQQWQTALHEAAGSGDPELVRVLLELGADVSARDARFGGTPLDWARYFEQPATAALLEGVDRTGR